MTDAGNVGRAGGVTGTSSVIFFVLLSLLSSFLLPTLLLFRLTLFPSSSTTGQGRGPRAEAKCSGRMWGRGDAKG